MTVLCPKCKAKLAIPDDKAGNPGLRLQCPGCTLKFPLGKASRPQAPRQSSSPLTATPAPVTGTTPVTAPITRPTARPASATRTQRPAAVPSASTPASGAARLPGQAVLGGVVAAVIGAVIWGALVAFLDREIGYVAWGIGVLVGAGVRQGLREGETAVLLCGGLAAASILAGKVMAFQFVGSAQIEALAEGGFTREEYDELKRDAEGFARIDPTSPGELSRYLVQHQYTEAESAESVSDEEREWFLEEQAPRLSEFTAARGGASYEEWRQSSIDAATRAMRRLPMKQRLLSMLGPLDLVFIGLGLWTAVKVGHGGGG